MEPDGNLEKTIRIACLLQFISHRSKVTARTVGELILKYHQPAEWKDKNNQSISREIGRISRGDLILNDEETRLWSTAIERFLRNVTAQHMRDSYISDAKGKPTLDSLIKDNKVLAVKRTADIPWVELQAYRTTLEQRIGISQYMRFAGSKPIPLERADLLSGAWLTFRVLSADEIYSNMAFLHADAESFRVSLTMATMEDTWVGDGFMPAQDQLVSYLGTSVGTSSVLVTSLDESRFIFSGLRLGQGPERIDDTIPIRTELVFGYRLHRGNANDPAVEDEIRKALDESCHADAPNREGSITAALLAIRNPTIGEVERRLIAQGFRRTAVEKRTGTVNALSSILQDLKERRPEVYAHLSELRINGQPIPQVEDASLVLTFRSHA